MDNLTLYYRNIKSIYVSKTFLIFIFFKEKIHVKIFLSIQTFIRFEQEIDKSKYINDCNHNSSKFPYKMSR